MSMKRLIAAALMVAGAAASAAAADTRVADPRRAPMRPACGPCCEARHVNAAEADGMTALHWAASATTSTSATLLLRAGADPNAATRYGVTPLALA